MTSKIIVTVESRPESEIALGERLSIGRSSENQLVINDGNTSRRHAEIRKFGGTRYRIIDLGSANGTWVNGRRLAAPKDLDDGDSIAIGNALIRFVAADAVLDGAQTTSESTMSTSLSMRNEMIVVIVTDIRGYTGLSEALPAEYLSKFVGDWFRESGQIVEEHGGTIDKFIGDALMAYWVVPNPDKATEEVSSALVTARKTVALSEQFAARLAADYPDKMFRIGIGLNMGEAIFGNVGTGMSPSFTIVGDSVNVAFRLETLAKELGRPVIASKVIVDNASKWFKFQDMGQVQVKGRQEPVSVSAMML